MDKSSLIIGKTYQIEYRGKDSESSYSGRGKLIELDPIDYPADNANFLLLDEPEDSEFKEGVFPIESIIREVPTTRIVICESGNPIAIMPENATKEQADEKCKELARKVLESGDLVLFYHSQVVFEIS